MTAFPTVVMTIGDDAEPHRSPPPRSPSRFSFFRPRAGKGRWSRRPGAEALERREAMNAGWFGVWADPALSSTRIIDDEPPIILPIPRDPQPIPVIIPPSDGPPVPPPLPLPPD